MGGLSGLPSRAFHVEHSRPCRMRDMECCICHRGLADGLALFRVNDVGQTGIWACSNHIRSFPSRQPDDEVQRLADILTGKRQPTGDWRDGE